MSKIFRQGDVLLMRVAALPMDVVPQAPENGRAVLAHGELTGHHHSVDASVAALFARSGMDEERYLEVREAAPLEHQEHAAINLEPGIYRVIRQREYHPEAVRRVAD